ncbi:uncharacterized protein LOC103974385 [Musa acuminata AAA Group]
MKKWSCCKQTSHDLSFFLVIPVVTGETFEPNCGDQYNKHHQQFYPSVNFLYSSNHLSDHHPVFFSLMQWNCCDIHVKEFDEFLSVPPFTTGWHNADTVWTLNNPNFHPGI